MIFWYNFYKIMYEMQGLSISTKLTRNLSFLSFSYMYYSMIKVQLDHLIVCLTQSVLTYSDLEALVGTWPEDIQSSRWKRWRWTFQEDKFTRLNSKIQEHKTSLNLVLNILQW